MQGANKIELTDSEEGTVVPVKAVPGSSRDRVAGVLGTRLKIAVSAAAEKGKANKAIAAVLARALGVPARRVGLVGGVTKANKQFVVEGMTAETVRRKLEAL